MESRCDSELIVLDCHWQYPQCEKPIRRNEYFSVSRIKLYEQCHAAYGFRYVKKTESGPKQVFATFGNLLHTTLENVFKWVRDDEFVGDIPMDKVLEFYQAAWTEYGLTGLSLYQEGLNILRQYVSRHPSVNHFNILAVEREFTIRVGPYNVYGFIDRVDKVDDETVRIIDYKSNRLLFTRDELDTDLQMSIYGLVAKEMWPWAKRFEFVFHMLRHGSHLETSRTDQELNDCRSYVIAVGKEMEEDQDLRPKLNPNCCYCDYRMKCDSYQSALAGKVEKLAYTKDDLVSVANAREQSAKLAKLFYARKKELEDIIRVQLETTDELELPEAGVRYRILTVANETIFSVDKTLGLLAKYTGEDKAELAKKLLRVDNKKLDELLSTIGETQKKKAAILRAELENASQRVLGSRFDAQPIKSNRKHLLVKSDNSELQRIVDVDEIMKLSS